MRILAVVFIALLSVGNAQNTSKEAQDIADDFLIKKDFANALLWYTKAKESLIHEQLHSGEKHPYIAFRIQLGKAVAYSLKNETRECLDAEMMNIWDEFRLDPY